MAFSSKLSVLYLEVLLTLSLHCDSSVIKRQSQVVFIPGTNGGSNGGNSNVQVVDLRKGQVQPDNNNFPADPFAAFTNGLNLLNDVNQLPNINIPLFNLPGPPIIYTGTRRSVRTVVFCQFSTMNLNCPPGTTINVTAASYGRQNATLCLNIPSNVTLAPVALYNQTQCNLGSATQIVQGMCQGLTTCNTYINSRTTPAPPGTPLAPDIFVPDPCPTVLKYLVVQYVCEGQSASPVLVPNTYPQNIYPQNVYPQNVYPQNPYFTG